MYTLYYLPGACSLAVHTLLNEVGAEFKLENVSVPAGQTRPAEYLKINPRGSVPTLVKDGFVIREAAAVLQYILDHHENSLLPKSGKERTTVLEWLSFANATLHPAYARLFFMHRTLGSDKALENSLYKPAIEALQKLWSEIEEQVSNQDYLCGNTCTVADILVTVIANWSPMLKMPLVFGEKSKAFFKRVSTRPAFQKAMETEKVTYKVAS